ncbi:MAG: PASTA domain-containing protein [Verrucomicrobiales bacterium]|nr:PASTA domain-containing protein [Verrucomicrobiales bacterium]
MNSFTVTAASKDVKLDAKNSAGVAFTVTNTTKKPVRGTPKLKVLGSTEERWLTLMGGGTRNFSPEESQQFVAQITVPENAKAGDYLFGLNISNEANPDEDFTEGPAVTFRVEQRTNGGDPFPWWIVIVLGLVVIGGGVATWWLLRPSKQVVPNVVGKPMAEASNLVTQAELRFEVSESVVTGANQIGLVIRQDPKADEKVDPDTLVRVAVGRDQEKVKVPRLIGLPPDRIAELFGALGLKFTEQGREFTGTQAAGVIAKQDPPDDQFLPPGSTVTYTVEAAKPEAPAPPYVGNWVNENTKTGGITRFDVRQQNGKIFVHMWGKCAPRDCDWGEMEGRPSGATRLLITWDQGFVVRSQTLTLIDKQRIRLESRSNFKDGRPPQTSSETFKKRELMIMHDFRTIRLQPRLNP